LRGCQFPDPLASHERCDASATRQGTIARRRDWAFGALDCPEQRAMKLKGKRIAILATNSFEQSELEVPRDKLKPAGAEVDVVSPSSGEIRGWDKKD
jgi:hypothetical protein